MTTVRNIRPQDIESLSFEIIEDEFFKQTSIEVTSLPIEQFPVIRRVIHATGDFSFARSLIFHEEAVQAGLRSIVQGRDVFIDVGMGASGINKTILNSFGGKVVCSINDPGIVSKAKAAGMTRTATALREISGQNPGIIAVGNAPTALIAAMELIDDGELNPDLVIGVPVGFVNAAESKDLLVKQPYPFISSIGRKGGSPVAVAIINALLKLAQERNTNDL